MGFPVWFAISSSLSSAMALAMKTKPMKKAAMKGAKPMKKAGVMKKGRVMKAKRVSIIARGKYARAAVFNGRKVKTASGMTAAGLMKSKSGRIVSKKASLRAK